MIGFSVKRAWRGRWGAGVCTLPPCSRHLYSATWVHSDTTWLWKLHKMEMPTCNKDWPGSSGLANHLNALVYKCYLISTMHSGVTQSLCLHNITPLVRSDKYFVSFSTCNPTTCSHWLTQSQKEADIYYLFIIG